jgi:hypothetical protein
MAAVAVLLLLVSRGSRRRQIDVADHSGRI